MKKSIANRVVGTLQDFHELEKYLLERGDKFSIIQSGSARRLIHKKKQYSFFPHKSSSNNGHHLSIMARRDIDKCLLDKKKLSELSKYKEESKGQLYNISAIKKAVGKLAVAIDVNDCYWQTAFNLGYITKKTYDSGLRKKEWKLGRNASVGGLAKSTKIISYHKGKEVLPRKNRIQAKESYRQVRHHIIEHIYNLFMQIYKTLPDDTFYMFLTDCVFTTRQNIKKVEKILRKNGYKCKSKSVEFISIDEAARKVTWVDFSKQVDVADAEKKYAHYAQYQVLGEK